MHNHLFVFSSDETNRYGSKFTVGALYSAMYDNCINGLPILVGHDATRQIGWTQVRSLYIEPGLTRLVGVGQIAETDEESRMAQQYFQNQINYRLQKKEKGINQLRGLLADYLDGDEKFILNECLSIVKRNIVKAKFPHLFPAEDKYMLTDLQKLDQIGHGVFKIDDFCVFANQYFRRSFNRLNTLNTPFLKNLNEFKGNGVKIAIDPDMIGLASTYEGEREELAYWWGPKFDNDILSIKNGVCHHHANDLEKLFYGIFATEFRWGTNNNNKILEIEELLDTAAEKTKYGCRYVHSMVSEETGEVFHLDGSVRIYSKKKMEERKEVDLAHALRNTKYKKLWRIDSNIPTNKWKSLISNYFRDNYSVGEYFGESIPDDLFPTKEEEISIIEKYVPYSMSEDMGLRIAVSLLPISENDNVDRKIISLDNYCYGENIENYVEIPALDLKKIFFKENLSIDVDEGIKYLSFKDRFINFPLIRHYGSNAQNDIKDTIGCLLFFSKYLAKKNSDWQISYTISYLLNESIEIRISVMGCIYALVNWLENPLAIPPIKKGKVKKWVMEVSKYLYENYNHNLDNPKLRNILMPTGILLMERKNMGLDNPKFSSDENGLKYEINTKKITDDFSQLLSSGIEIGNGMLIKESTCSNCGDSFLECNCSRICGDNSGQIISDMIPFLFWTNKTLVEKLTSKAEKII